MCRAGCEKAVLGVLARVREYNGRARLALADAVAAIDDCIREGHLVEYLKAKRAEVFDLFMIEYDEAVQRSYDRREGLVRPLAAGCCMRAGNLPSGRGPRLDRAAFHAILNLLHRGATAAGEKLAFATPLVSGLGAMGEEIGPLFDAAAR